MECYGLLYYVVYVVKLNRFRRWHSKKRSSMRSRNGAAAAAKQLIKNGKLLYLQFEMHGGPLQSFIVAGCGSSLQPLPAGRLVPNHTHFTERCLMP